jgi:octaprenyl-diphosphate synthase
VKTVTKTSHILAEISEYLKPELDAVNREINAVIESDTRLVKEVGDYVLSGRGKRLRPIMLLLVSKACGFNGANHINVAAALEIIHTATLLHDDVIDKAELRRGRPSVNARWGDDVAILIADYLYANAFRLAMQSLSPVVISTICQVTAQMCEGEMYQIEKRQQFLTTDDYLRIVRHKTAFLFSACTGLGAVLAELDEPDILKLTRYGMDFGIAFQITDDTLDLVGQDDELGKDSGTDIRNGKQTLPLISAFEAADETEREKLRAMWNNGGDARPMLDIIQAHNGVEHSLSLAREYSEKAKHFLTVLPAGRASDYLAQLADYVIERTR